MRCLHKSPFAAFRVASCKKFLRCISSRLYRPLRDLCVGIALATLLSACANTGAPPYAQSYAGGPQHYAGEPQQKVAIVTPRPKLKLEDDGLPQQAPPRRRFGQEPDNPTEPYSPNYGAPPVAAEEPAPPASTFQRRAFLAPPPHASAPSSYPRQPTRHNVRVHKNEMPSGSFSNAKAERLIAQAIAKHEMYNP